MIPSPFEYLRPATLEEAVVQLQLHGEEAKVLAGGHSLLPAMKLRLAQPATLIDLGRIPELKGIRDEGETIAIGAMATHHEIASSALLLERCPLLPEVAEQIGDVQVRNRGTLGGSLVHADPAADWPAAILALDAEMEIADGLDRRTVPAREFFVDLMQSAIQPAELLVAIRVPKTGRAVAYEKFAQKASGFAIAGVAAALDLGRQTVRVGITGVAAVPFRAAAVEAELRTGPLTPDRIASASAFASEGVEALNDIHASSEFRLHLARTLTRRALDRALARA
jgi:aerobic carbon-monoxide dehydrogenase medium subunit